MTKKLPTKIYGLVFMIPDQKLAIDLHCLGKCKKIIMGAIDAGPAGPLMICRTDKKDCIAFFKEMDVSIGDVNGESIFLRRLKL